MTDGPSRITHEAAREMVTRIAGMATVNHDYRDEHLGFVLRYLKQQESLEHDLRRAAVKALGFHVCDSCNDMRAGTWEEARDAGWVHGTFGPGPDGATLCDECHAGQGE